MTYYIVSYEWYEDYQPIIVRGPKVRNWTAFCDGLIEEAAQHALDTNSENTYIGWQEVVMNLVAILAERGYEEVEFPEARYWGSNIIKAPSDSRHTPHHELLGRAGTAIIRHNKKIDQKPMPTQEELKATLTTLFGCAEREDETLLTGENHE